MCGPYVSEQIRSYHITKDDTFTWPPTGITGEYCCNYYYANNEYEKMVKEDSKGEYKLISYPTIVEGFFFPSIIRVGANMKIHKENKC